MPPTKPRQRGSRGIRFNHLDALGGIELKAYVRPTHASGAAPSMHVGDVDAKRATPLVPSC